MKVMNAKQIGEALTRKPDVDESIRLQQACELRRAEIRERLANIVSSGHHLFADPPEIQAATLKGPLALQALESEAELLKIELASLERLEAACVDALERARDEHARRAIPTACKALPRAMDAVRAKAAALAAAIAELNTMVEMIATYDRLADRKLPLSDTELSELLSLRNSLWQPREVAAIHPPAGYAKSWPLFFDTRHGGETVIVRRPGPHLPDYA